jgi:hypothetical protein
VGSEDAILGRQVLIARQQLLVDQAGYKGQKACSLESIAHGMVHHRPRPTAAMRARCPMNIFIKRGQRVMESVTRFITEELKLKVNEPKSAVARPQERNFLGFSFTDGPEIRRVIAPNAVDRFKQRIREITRRAKGVSMETTMKGLTPYMRGWRSYFGFCENARGADRFDRWVRLRLRAAM